MRATNCAATAFPTMKSRSNGRSTCVTPARATKSPWPARPSRRRRSTRCAKPSMPSTKLMFGHMAPEEPVEVVSYRVRGVGIVPAVDLPKFKPEGRTLSDALRETRQVRFDGAAVSMPGLSARKARCRLDLARAGHPRSIRLHHGDLRRARPRASMSGRISIVTDGEFDAMPIDAVDLEVIKASLSGIVQEMQNSLFRTGFSTIVRELQDASCALMNAQGDVVAQHVVLPLHIGAFPACCAAVLARIRRRHRRRRRLSDQPSLSGRQPARAGHGGDHAGLRRRRAVRLLRLDRAQERHRRPGAGQLLGPGARNLQRRPASAGGALSAAL